MERDKASTARRLMLFFIPMIQGVFKSPSRIRLAPVCFSISLIQMHIFLGLIVSLFPVFCMAGKAEPPPKYSQELQQQADSGDADAQFHVGDCYFFGLGIPKDQRKGVNWYRKAAEAGQMQAQFNLGGCLHEGLGIEPNLMEAIQWWRRSAGQDYAPAQISIGDCYIFGKGLPQDEEEGVRWFRKAAMQNYPAAQHRLGNCYFNGQGVRSDVVQAIQWYRKAADQGYQPSIRALQKLEKE
ncbi:MAG: sel1 repeat family protein [Verrucomicrobia bacterium]|nr:sel1 repeat family protein [Verrucomicrobiota bacterium]